MPSHVRNIITIKDGDKAKEIFEAIKNDKVGIGSIDFNKIIPMPDHVFKGNLGTEERKKYGSDNWYDFSIRNWGTKWNAYDFADYDGGNSIGFNTAWSSPTPIIEKLGEMYPEVVINHQWADEDIGFNVGEVEYYNNECNTVDIPSGGSKEAYEMAAGIHKLDLKEYGYRLSDDGSTYEYDEDLGIGMKGSM